MDSLRAQTVICRDHSPIDFLNIDRAICYHIKTTIASEWSIELTGLSLSHLMGHPASNSITFTVLCSDLSHIQVMSSDVRYDDTYGTDNVVGGFFDWLTALGGCVALESF